MTEFRVVAGETSNWNSIVEQTTPSTVFHQIDWLKTVEKHTKCELYPLLILKGEEIAALLPLFLRRKPYGDMFESPVAGCMVPYLGPLFPHLNEYKENKKESVLKGFQDALNKFIDAKRAGYVKVMCPPGYFDMRQYQWSGYDVEYHYTYSDTLSDIDTLWQGLKKGLRKNIVSAQKNGITIIEGKREDIDYVYDSVARRLREQGETIPMPKQYFLDLYDIFHDENLRIFLAEYKGGRVGGVIAVLYKGKVCIWFGAVRPDIEGLYPNDLLHWSIIKWASEQGYNTFEISGADIPTISSFKSRFNLGLQLLFSAKKYRNPFIRYAAWAENALWSHAGRFLSRPTSSRDTMAEAL